MFARYQDLNMGGEVWRGSRLIGIGCLCLMFGNQALDTLHPRLHSERISRK